MSTPRSGSSFSSRGFLLGCGFEKCIMEESKTGPSLQTLSRPLLVSTVHPRQAPAPQSMRCSRLRYAFTPVSSAIFWIYASIGSGPQAKIYLYPASLIFSAVKAALSIPWIPSLPSSVVTKSSLGLTKSSAYEPERKLAKKS